jgi:hypothetical protein
MTSSTNLGVRAENPSRLLLPGDVEAVGRYVQASTSEATLRAYAADWRSFEAWCSTRGLHPLPADPSTVAAHLAALADAGASSTTVRRRASGIGWAHERAGHESQPGIQASGRRCAASDGQR